jgi:cytochrome c peroxidase
LSSITKKPDYNSKLRVPSLRNVLLKAPYMHDGSVETIDEVLEIYAKCGRNIDYGIYQGNGVTNKYKSSLIKGFSMSKQEKTDLINFLYTLSTQLFILLFFLKE